MIATQKTRLLRDALARRGATWISCGGGSMEPTIPRGARVMVVPCSRARAGDVVLLATRGAPVAHRVLLAIPRRFLPWRRAGLLVHAGDAGRFAAGAGLIDDSRVIGKVEGVAPVVARTRRVLGTVTALARALVGQLTMRVRGPKML